MDTKLLVRIFDNPEVEKEVRRLCKKYPEYHAALAELHAWYEKVEKLLGEQEFFRFEEAVSYFFSWEAQAYYVIGLHLREELKQAMMER